MNEEDEAFNEIERKAKQRMEAVRVAMRGVEDDDIQEYKKPWVGLTPDELNMIGDSMKTWNSFSITDVYFAIEAKLKEKNT